MRDKIEALLFSAGRKMEVEELAKLCKSSSGEIAKALNGLKKDYDDRNSPLMIVQEGSNWKLTVRETYLDLVQKIITETELSRTIMETLAVIAWKYPVLQSEVIKIRTNKAYEHLGELEEMGYIARERKGRTRQIKLTQKFFDYFDLPKEKLKDKFKDFDEVARVIEAKETEIATEKAAAKEAEKQAGGSSEPEVDLIDKEGHKQKLEVVDETKIEPTEEEIANTKVMPYEGKLGKLEVVDEKPEEERAEEEITEEPEEKEDIEEDKESEGRVVKEIKPKRKGKKGKGIKLSQEQEKMVDKRVEDMLNPPKEGAEKPAKQEGQPGEITEEPEENKGKESESEPMDLLEASSKKNKGKK
tara:strand:- start:1149 stop:2222 length:1074 start_codon:yes stop_codon:yes gene_type:complete